MVQLEGEGLARRWLAKEGPFLAVYDAPERAADHSKPRAVVSCSSFSVTKGQVRAHRALYRLCTTGVCAVCVCRGLLPATAFALP
jgi:hypothetical protein